MSLGQGYTTPLSEEVRSFRGQRQRIAIARTILSNPQLLVMDEATSALDYDTERQLVLNLQQWSKSRTVFFITHRLSTIKTSDTIILMHKALEEHGSHEELMDLNCRYAALFRQQDTSPYNCESYTWNTRSSVNQVKTNLDSYLYKKVQVFLKTRSTDVFSEIIPDLYRKNKHELIQQLIKIIDKIVIIW